MDRPPNGRGATRVAASLRARPRAPVAAPWPGANCAPQRPDTFTLGGLPTWLARQHKDPRADIDAIEQDLSQWVDPAVSRRIEAGEPTARGPSLGASYVYVVACCGEDLVKLGFARDPLARLHAFHPRYFEFFDLDSGFLVALDAVAEARRLELRLRRPLAAHRAPPPLTVRPAAGGGSEWLRGAWPALAATAMALAGEGFTVHRPLRDWLTHAFSQRADRVYAWAEQAVSWMDSGQRHASLPPALARVRDTLDAAAAFGLELADVVSPRVHAWYRQLR